MSEGRVSEYDTPEKLLENPVSGHQTSYIKDPTHHCIRRPRCSMAWCMKLVLDRIECCLVECIGVMAVRDCDYRLRLMAMQIWI